MVLDLTGVDSIPILVLGVSDSMGGESVSDDSESASLIVVVFDFAKVDAFAGSGDSKLWTDGACVSISVS